jgi:hypothetical protein
MKLFSAAALAVLATAPTLASAAGLIDFEKSWDFLNGDVNGYYAGGTAADGTTGPNRGVSFVNISGLSNDASFTYYSGAPSMLGTAYAHTFAADDKAFMNVAGGTVGVLSFYYSSPLAVLGAVKAYSGLNATGSLLGTFDLAANASSLYDSWTLASFAFGGVARSFDFSAGANVVGLDNVNVAAVPEPGTVLLMLTGGAALLGVRNRRRRV